MRALKMSFPWFCGVLLCCEARTSTALLDLFLSLIYVPLLVRWDCARSRSCPYCSVHDPRSQPCATRALYRSSIIVSPGISLVVLYRVSWMGSTGLHVRVGERTLMPLMYFRYYYMSVVHGIISSGSKEPVGSSHISRPGLGLIPFYGAGVERVWRGSVWGSPILFNHLLIHQPPQVWESAWGETCVAVFCAHTSAPGGTC